MSIKKTKSKILIFIIISILMVCISTINIYAYNNFWSGEAIADFIHNDINLSDNIFNDDRFTENITREEFAELIVSIYSISSKINLNDIPLKENPFKDTNSINVQRAYSLGLVNGINKENYKPKSNITREQLATIITRFLSINEIQTSPEGNLDNYLDNKDISEWAYDSMTYCIEQEIIKGYLNNELLPQNFATIEQALTILDRIALKNEWIIPSEDTYYNGFFARRDNTELQIGVGEEIYIPIKWINIENCNKLEDELRYMLNSKLSDTEQIDELIETVMGTRDYHLTNIHEFEKIFEIDGYRLSIGAKGSISTKKKKEYAKSYIRINKIQ